MRPDPVWTLCFAGNSLLSTLADLLPTGTRRAICANACAFKHTVIAPTQMPASFLFIANIDSPPHRGIPRGIAILQLLRLRRPDEPRLALSEFLAIVEHENRGLRLRGFGLKVSQQIV